MKAAITVKDGKERAWIEEHGIWIEVNRSPQSIKDVPQLRRLSSKYFAEGLIRVSSAVTIRTLE